MQGKTFEFQFPHFSCDIQNSFSCLTSQVTVACLIFNFQTSIRLSNWNYESVEIFGDNLGKLPVRTWQLVNQDVMLVPINFFFKESYLYLTTVKN